MAEVRPAHAHETSSAPDAKKRKGFFSNIFGRSSNGNGDGNANSHQAQQNNGGFMSNVKNVPGQVAEKVAVHEASKEIEKWIDNPNSTTNNNNASGSQTTAGLDTSEVSDALNAPTNWAKRMVGTAQQKLQSLSS